MTWSMSDGTLIIGVLAVLLAVFIVGLCLLLQRAGKDFTATITGLGVRVTLASKTGLKRRSSDHKPHKE